MEDRNHLYECTDLGNAQRFVDQHSEYLKAIDGSFGWLSWTGKRWEPVSSARAYQAAKQTLESILLSSDNLSSTELRQQQMWALSSQSKARIQAMLDLASKHQDMIVNLSDFDNRTKSINTSSGLYVIGSDRLESHQAKPLVTKMTNAAYNPEATCPRFIRFLDEVFDGDKELISWVKRALGYSLLGNTDEQCLFIAYGTGANGKSTLFEIIREVLGDYAKVTDFELFLNSHKSDVRMLEAIGELAGVRFALASEVDSNKRFSDSVIKRLTGGDTLRGTKLRQSSFEFKPQFKLWFLANHLPFAKDGSYGFWRRIKVIPFNRQFSASERDPHLHAKLMKERDGILGWLLEGAREWLRTQKQTQGDGIGSCKAVDDAIQAYRDDNDFISQFLQDATGQKDGHEVAARDLFSAYQRWAAELGSQYELSENLFARRMAERGLEKKRTKRGYVYKDIALAGLYSF